MPLVSVIIPVHDAGPYLHTCLQSVREQTHRDLHIVCVDDGSRDESAAVLERHADADARVETVWQPNAGPGAARNAGLGRAAGDFITFVDADDWIPTEAVERHLNALRHSRSDFSTGRVMRVAGTHRWPSSLHENGHSWPAPATHIVQEPGLLFDTTSWNKLFRRDYWAANRFAFPERVLFEDVSLMIEAHCRASSVEVLTDVVYYWRRRDDGVASITMRRDDPGNLVDRVESLRCARRLLREVAPPSLRRAAEHKFLRHDLGSYFRDLEDMQPDFQNLFVRLVREFVESSSIDVVDTLPPHLRVAYRLVGQGRRGDLMDYLAFLRENGWRLPVRRRGLLPRAELGPAHTTVPRRYSSARRRMPLRMGVHGLAWQDDTLVIEGHGVIDGIAMNHPAAALRRLQLIDTYSRDRRHVWIAPRRLPAGDERGRTARPYDWSAFRVEVPITLLDPGATRDRARWEVNLQVLAPGAGSGSALGPPSGSAFAEVRRGPAGLLFRADWVTGRRLVIDAVRAVVALTAVDSRDGLLHLSLRQVLHRPGAAPHTARLTSAVGAMVDVPLVSSSDRVEETLHAVVDLALLQLHRGVRTQLQFQLTVVGPDGVTPVIMDLANALTFPLENENLVVGDDGRGGVELVVGAARAVVEDVSWIADTVQIRGVCGPDRHALPRLAWCHSSGGVIEAVTSRTDDGFVATFELMELPGPDGVHPPAAGEWTLRQRQADGSWEPAVTSFGPTSPSARARSLGAFQSVRIGLSPRRELVMSVAAPRALEQGALDQERLQRGVYRRARRAPVTSVVLLQTWGGKKFADNPRALVESLPAAWSESTVVVVVSDRSIRVPEPFGTVIAGSRDHYEQLARARLVISNDTMPFPYVKRPGQRYLQTWHGTPLKRIGLDIPRIRFRNRNYVQELRTEAASWDWLVSQNRYSTEIFRRAFAYDGQIIECGYPRNDLLTDQDQVRRQARREAARRWLDIRADQTAVLWAPTWRDDVHAAGGGYGTSLLVDRAQVQAILPDNTILLLHGHHLAGAAQTHLGRDDLVRDVSSYPDVRDLILASDALLTDYSSIMFDYALTGRPMIFFVPDLAHYAQIRGLYLDLATVAPGPVVSTLDELADALRSLSSITTARTVTAQAFGRRFCDLDDGQAAQRVWATVTETSG